MKILVVDDHSLIFSGIQALFEDTAEFEVLPHLVQRCTDIMPSIHQWQPHILLLDVNLRNENSLLYLPDIRREFPRLRILVMTTYIQNTVLQQAAEAGAEAFLTKDLTLDELLFALEAGKPGKPFISEGVAALHPELYQRRETPITDPFGEQFGLTRREVEIVKFVVAGMTTESIAESLYLSTHTVHTHRRNILSKLGLHSTPELVRWAYESKLA